MNVETLRQVPLFESLDAEAAHELCELLESLDSKAGAVLFRTGDEGDAMYLVEDGKVRICVRAKDGHEVTLTELHRGDFFGEMALLDGKPRSADARVAEDARLAVLSREHFLSFVSSNPIGYATQMNFCATLRPATSMSRKQRSLPLPIAQRILLLNLAAVGNLLLLRWFSSTSGYG